MATEPRLIHCDPEIMGGIPVFVGTRVPVKTLFQHLAAGDSLEVFLDDFPTVSADIVTATLGLASKLLVAHAHSA